MTEKSGMPADVDGLPPRPHHRRTLLWWIVTVCAVVAMFVAGWTAATVFESPAQRAASARTPAAAPITAEVVKGDLQTVVTAQATVRRTQSQTASVASSSTPAVVTGTAVAVHGALNAGSRVLDVNGQPVFAMPGTFPFYRDLTPGDTGPDITQLQRGLNAAGYALTVDGSFGARTTSALTDLFRSAGYAVPTSGAGSTDTGADASSGTSGAGDGATAVTGTTASGTSASAGSATAADSGTTLARAQSAQVLDVPASSFMVFSSLPADVIAIPAVGTTLDSKTTVSVESGSPVVIASVAPSTASGLKKGMPASIQTPDGRRVTMSVAVIGTPAKAGDNAPVTLAPGSGAVDGALLHQNVLATITIQTSAKDSLLVPTRAVVTSNRKTTYVLKEESGNVFREIPVTEIATLGGKSAITVTGDALSAGDQVQVR